MSSTQEACRRTGAHHVGESDAVAGRNERHVERGFQCGLVPARQRTTRVGGLELRQGAEALHAIWPRIARAIEAFRLLGERAAVFERQAMCASLLEDMYKQRSLIKTRTDVLYQISILLLMALKKHGIDANKVADLILLTCSKII